MKKIVILGIYSMSQKDCDITHFTGWAGKLRSAFDHPQWLGNETLENLFEIGNIY